MRYRINPNRPLRLRVAAHLETSGPLGQDASELAERCGASVEDVEGAIRMLLETDHVEPVDSTGPTHDIPSPVDLAMQETAAAYAKELRTHVELARAKSKATDAQRAAYHRAKHAHAAAHARLRQALDEET